MRNDKMNKIGKTNVDLNKDLVKCMNEHEQK